MLVQRFVAMNAQFGALVLSEDVSEVRVGEMVFVQKLNDELDVSVVISNALYAWVDEYADYDAFANGKQASANCAQMLWASTRYMGCSYDQCAAREIRVVCLFYSGAEVGAVPFAFGAVCAGCRDSVDTSCSSCACATASSLATRSRMTRRASVAAVGSGSPTLSGCARAGMRWFRSTKRAGLIRFVDHTTPLHSLFQC